MGAVSSVVVDGRRGGHGHIGNEQALLQRNDLLTSRSLRVRTKGKCPDRYACESICFSHRCHLIACLAYHTCVGRLRKSKSTDTAYLSTETQFLVLASSKFYPSKGCCERRRPSRNCGAGGSATADESGGSFTHFSLRRENQSLTDTVRVHSDTSSRVFSFPVPGVPS